ncbi:MAG: phosphatase PAP2 family protein [Solirubrobacterales bacterium]
MRARVTGTRLVLALATGLIVAVAGCGNGGDSSAQPAEPSAGQWKTWVLSWGSEIEVPPPPAAGSEAASRDLEQLEQAVSSRTPNQEDEARHWDEQPAMAPWMEDAMEFVSQRPKDPPYSSRAYAYVAVAIYDAAVSAWSWKQRYAREAPSEDPLVEAPPDPSYPSEHAAIAGAASRVLHYLFPEHPAQRLDQDAQQAAQSRVKAGVAYPSDVQAGLDLGRQVADRVIAYARTDGISRQWDGTRPPHTPAYWDPPPGSAARPVEPLAGAWRTWVIGSPERFQPPPPPRYRSPRFMKGVQRVISAEDNLTPVQKEAALFWAGGQGTPLPAGIWEGVIVNYLRDRNLTTPEAARVFALASVAMADAGVAAWATKYKWWYPRPENSIRDTGADPKWKPLVPTPFFPAYTSGHATYSAAVAQVLSYLFPEDTDDWHQKASQAAKARIWGGIHWPWDSAAGLRQGERVGDLVVAHAKADGADQ